MYAVIWRDAALNELADAFVLADLARCDALEQSVLRLNAQLAADPREVGESRSGNLRVAFDKPVAINFLVDDPMPDVVRVTHFRTY